MNKQIRLIALLADKAIRETDLREVNGGIHITPAFEKFAELIIRESVAVADDYVKDCTCEEHINCKPRTSAIGRKIQEHFGVKREQTN